MSTRGKATSATCVATVLCLLGFAPIARAADGAAQYARHCARCHGDVTAPKFVGRSADDVVRAITAGKGRMSRVPLDTPEDAAAIAALTADTAPALAPAAAPGPNPAALQRIAKGDELAAAKEDTLALHAYLDAINLDPRNVRAHLKLAGQYARMGHPEQAAQQWEFVLGLEPGNEEAARSIRAGGAARKP